MRRILILVGAIATLAAGVTAAVALGAGTTAPDTSTDTTTAVAGATTTTAPDTSTGTTTTTAAGATTTAAGATATTAQDTSTGTTTAVAGATTATTTTAPSKVWVCHHTGSWKHPYHLIHISTHALPAHISHGDHTPGADNSCPTTQPAGTKAHGRGNGQSNNAKTKDDNPGKGDDEPETNDD